MGPGKKVKPEARVYSLVFSLVYSLQREARVYSLQPEASCLRVYSLQPEASCLRNMFYIFELLLEMTNSFESQGQSIVEA
jgi:hypothetical protein